MLEEGSDEAKKIFEEFDATGPYVEEPKESAQQKKGATEVEEKKEDEKPVPIHLKDSKQEEIEKEVKIEAKKEQEKEVIEEPTEE